MSGIDQIARAALAAALNSLWIGVALAVAAWVLARCLPRTNAATRHLLWWTVLALVLILPFVARVRESVGGPVSQSVRGLVHGLAGAPVSGPVRGLIRGLDQTPAHALLQDAARGLAVAAPFSPATIVRTVFTPRPRTIFPLRIPAGSWLRAAIALWVLFGLMQLFRLAWSFAYLRKVKRGAQAAPEALAERFRYWVAACAIRRPVRLLISSEVVSPLATGFRHPAVILPAPLVAQFGQRELDHVLLHELAHVARRDDWTNLLARCLGAIAGLHPVAAWAMGQIARERELASDDWVVSRTGEARPYAASLARLFELCRTQRRIALAAGMAGSPSQLGRRIETLLDSGRQFSGRASLVRVAVTAMALLALVAAGTRAPRWIVLAQSTAAHETPRPDTHPSLPQAGAHEPGGIALAQSAAVPSHDVSGTPVNPHGSFLAALVATGYGNLSVDEIIALKEHGVDARFLAGINQSGWERLTPAELIELHDHGVPAEMLRTLRETGFQHLQVREVINAFEQGVRPATLKEAAEYGSHLTLAQIVKLKQAGVIQ